MNKNTKIIILTVVALTVIMYFLFIGNDIFVVVFSMVVIIGLFNAVLQLTINRFKNKQIIELKNKLEITMDVINRKDIAEKQVTEEIPLGIILYNSKFDILWANNYSKKIFENDLENRNIETINKAIFKNVSKNEPSELFLQKIYADIFEISNDKVKGILYLTPVTEREIIKNRYDESIDVIGVLNLDNLDDAISVLDVSEKSVIQGKYLGLLDDWANEFGMYVVPLTPSKLIAFMNKKELDKLITNGFKIVDEIANLSKENDLHITLSAGIACSDIKLNKLGEIAQESLNQALSRGGDQVVVNIADSDLKYFGGNSNTAEKRTRITTRINTQKLEKLFDESHAVYIMPHKFPDTDAIGAAMGVLKLALASKKEAYIILNFNELDKTVKKIIQLVEYEYITLLDHFVTVEDSLDSIKKDDLLILVDHHSYGQTVDKRILTKTKKLVIIDHHRKLSDAIPNALISYIEPYASSSVELIVEMISVSSNEVELNQFEATVMLSGIMVDTNNFMYRTGARTFEAAAILRKYGADTFKVKTILRESIEEIQLKSKLLAKAELFNNQFGIVEVPENIPAERNLLAKIADDLLEIDNTIAAFAIAKIDDNTIGISARSLDKFNVQIIMEQFDGGGHLNNAGAQVSNKSIKEVKEKLIEILTELNQEDKPMKVILIKDVKNRGKKGEIIEVATGFANYLLTSKNAIEATNENMQTLEDEKQKLLDQEKKELEEMRDLKNKIDGKPVKVFVKIGENGKLFGKINSKHIADEFNKQHNIKIDKRKIQLKGNISSLGNHDVEIKLHRKVTAKIDVLVVEE
ncbi:MAG: 50S ribosomal protein L9 [Candidatus Izemoplasma sp.]